MNNLDENVYDVIIVGAGLSGTSAGYFLTKRVKNLKILFIEAKDRVGGRTQTISLKSANGTSRWDIGGQWCGESQKNLLALLNELNVETYRQYDTGKKMLESNGKITSYNSSVPCSSFLSWLDMQLYMKRADKYITKLDTIYPYADPKLAEYLESKNAKDFLYSKILTPTTRSIITSNMRTVFGLELEQLNALFALNYIKMGGGSIEGIMYSDEGCAQESRVKGGTQQISQKCLQRCLDVSPQTNKVLLNTVLLHVDQTDPNSVLILTENTQTGERHEFRARKLISSIPINQYPQIVFEPELPYYKRAFHKFCQAGNYIKFLVTYKTTFWRPKGMSGEGTFDGSVKWVNEERFERFDDDSKDRRLRRMPTLGAVAEVFDGTNEDKQPALVGFIAGKAAVEWAEQSDELRRNEVIEDLARVYGPEARDYVDYCEKNWAYEPYNGGCPCFNVVAPGVMIDVARATREPFLNVHFCGTESATVWNGYMDGAVQSGERVANEILYKFYENDEKNRHQVQIDYEKTYYYQENYIKKKLELEASRENSISTRIISYSKCLAKFSMVLGMSYFVLNRFKKTNFILNGFRTKLFNF